MSKQPRIVSKKTQKIDELAFFIAEANWLEEMQKYRYEQIKTLVGDEVRGKNCVFTNLKINDETSEK